MSSSSNSPLPKACENCRIRKVRCNRQNPCSNCETSNISCRPAEQPGRRKPRNSGPRGSPSSTTNRHDGPENGSQALHPRASTSQAYAAGQPHTASSFNSSKHLSSTGTDNLRVLAEAAEQSPATSAPFEGSSSFADQAIHASRMAGVDVEPTNGMSGAFHQDSIRTAIETPKDSEDHEYCFPGTMQRNQVSMEMPPAPFILDLLKQLKKKPSKMFLAYCLHSMVPNLEMLCQSAYFPIEPLSFGALATMYGLLYYLTMDLFVDTESPLAKKYDYEAYSKILETNFHLALENYSVVVTPTTDNIRGLCLGMMKAHSDNKPLLCWSLTCAAARQVLGLGYHRESTFKDLSQNEQETRRSLFWFVYVFDKSLALRLGRTPNVQDYDIDVNWFKISDDPQIAPYDRTNIHFVKLARIQGIIYERLYSVGALRATREERSANVEEISRQLDDWYREWKTFDNSKAIYYEFFYACFNIMEPIFYATRALVHRASTGTSAEVTPACYNAASQSLHAYLRAFKDMQAQQSYLYAHAFVDEILFYTSLTPLVIIFLHTITSPNYSDVDLLVKCQETLEHLKQHSKETARILRVCKIFSRVARSRLQASASSEKSQSFTGNSGTNGPLTDIQQAMQISTSNDLGPVQQDEFGTFSMPEDFDYNQMSAFFSGWLESDRMPAELFDLMN